MTRSECRATLGQVVQVSSLWVVILAVVVGSGRVLAAEVVEKEVKKLGSVPADLVVSGDGTRVAFVTRKDAGQVVVCDGKEGPACDQVKNLTFSGNGKVLAYAASKDNRWCIVAASKPGPAHSDVEGPALSYDGTVLAYYSSEGGTTGTVYVNGAPREHQTAVGKVAPVVSPNGRVAFVARGSGTFGKATSGSGSGGTRSSTWGVTDTVDRRLYVVCDRSRGKLYNDLRRPVFSPDSQRLAYAALFEGKWFIVCDKDQVGGPHEEVSDPVWSSNSGKIAYAARNGDQWFVVSPGRRYGPVEAVGLMAFSDRGRHLAYAAGKGGRQLLACDGKNGPAFDKVHWIAFSENEQHLACVVEQNREWLMVVDGVPGPRHARVYPLENAALGGKLRYVAVDGGEARLLEVTWPASGDWRNAPE